MPYKYTAIIIRIETKQNQILSYSRSVPTAPQNPNGYCVNSSICFYHSDLRGKSAHCYNLKCCTRLNFAMKF